MLQLTISANRLINYIPCLNKQVTLLITASIHHTMNPLVHSIEQSILLFLRSKRNTTTSVLFLYLEYYIVNVISTCSGIWWHIESYRLHAVCTSHRTINSKLLLIGLPISSKGNSTCTSPVLIFTRSEMCLSIYICTYTATISLIVELDMTLRALR